jgi:hypothetical protein
MVRVLITPKRVRLIVVAIIICISIQNGVCVETETELNSAWGEVIRVEEGIWDYEAGLIDINKATEDDLTERLGMDAKQAEAVVLNRERDGNYTSFSNLQQRNKLKPSLLETLTQRFQLNGLKITSARLHIRASQRFGQNADQDADRYSGSPTGLTERLTIQKDDLSCGLLIDKDPFETQLNDLQRFYA